MSYRFDFASVLDAWPQLVQGAGVTLGLTAVGTLLGLGLGILGAVSRGWRLPVLSKVFTVYVEAVRNTPFLAQLFFIFFGLPSLGFKLTGGEASVLAMVVNLGAYLTEIIRAGIEGTPKGVLEASDALGLSRSQCFRHVVLRPALARVWPSVSSQVVIVMLGSSVCSQIAAQELTFAAGFIQSRNFRAFETYFVSTGLYLLMALLVRRVLSELGKRLVPGGGA